MAATGRATSDVSSVAGPAPVLLSSRIILDQDAICITNFPLPRCLESQPLDRVSQATFVVRDTASRVFAKRQNGGVRWVVHVPLDATAIKGFAPRCGEWPVVAQALNQVRITNKARTECD